MEFNFVLSGGSILKLTFHSRRKTKTHRGMQCTTLAEVLGTTDVKVEMSLANINCRSEEASLSLGPL